MYIELYCSALRSYSHLDVILTLIFIGGCSITKRNKIIGIILAGLVVLGAGIGGGYLLFNGNGSTTTSHSHLSESSFIDGALTKAITEVGCTLSDGTETTCN